MNVPSSKDVLNLYRNLLRYGKQLKLTDKTYFINRIRGEFKEKKYITKVDDQKFQYERGLALLKNKRIV